MAVVNRMKCRKAVVCLILAVAVVALGAVAVNVVTSWWAKTDAWGDPNVPAPYPRIGQLSRAFWRQKPVTDAWGFVSIVTGYSVIALIFGGVVVYLIKESISQ